MSDSEKPKELSRKHHIVPQFFLANFTSTGDKSGEIWRFDTQEVCAEKGNVASFAYIEDFYNVEAGGRLDDSYEQAYSKIESRAAPVIRKIIETKQVPTGNELDSLVAFIASLERRGLGAKAVLDDFVNDVSQFTVELLQHHYDDWIEGYKKENPGEAFPSKADLQQAMKDGVQFETHPNFRVPAAWDWATMVYPLLRRRPWCLWTRAATAPEFVCSDSPVGLDSIYDSSGFWQPPPFGEGSLVTLPISKDMALVSLFEGNLANVEGVTENHIASINLLTGRSSKRWLFASKSDFSMKLKNDRMGGWSDLQEDIKASRA